MKALENRWHPSVRGTDYPRDERDQFAPLDLQVEPLVAVVNQLTALKKLLAC